MKRILQPINVLQLNNPGRVILSLDLFATSPWNILLFYETIEYGVITSKVERFSKRPIKIFGMLLEKKFHTELSNEKNVKKLPAK